MASFRGGNAFPLKVCSSFASLFNILVTWWQIFLIAVSSWPSSLPLLISSPFILVYDSTLKSSFKHNYLFKDIIFKYSHCGG